MGVGVGVDVGVGGTSLAHEGVLLSRRGCVARSSGERRGRRQRAGGTEYNGGKRADRSDRDDTISTGKVDVRLPGKMNSNSHGARPVHQIITMPKRIRTSGLSIKNSLSAPRPDCARAIKQICTSRQENQLSISANKETKMTEAELGVADHILWQFQYAQKCWARSVRDQGDHLCCHGRQALRISGCGGRCERHCCRLAVETRERSDGGILSRIPQRVSELDPLPPSQVRSTVCLSTRWTTLLSSKVNLPERN